jgi:hypothetical protein
MTSILLLSTKIVSLIRTLSKIYRSIIEDKYLLAIARHEQHIRSLSVLTRSHVGVASADAYGRLTPTAEASPMENRDSPLVVPCSVSKRRPAFSASLVAFRSEKTLQGTHTLC